MRLKNVWRTLYVYKKRCSSYTRGRYLTCESLPQKGFFLVTLGSYVSPFKYVLSENKP